MKEYKVGSLFAGVGGICLGFQNAKTENACYKLAWANEIDEYACTTYRTNFGHMLLEGDIKKVVHPELVDQEIIDAEKAYEEAVRDKEVKWKFLLQLQWNREKEVVPFEIVDKKIIDIQNIYEQIFKDKEVNRDREVLQTGVIEQKIVDLKRMYEELIKNKKNKLELLSKFQSNIDKEISQFEVINQKIIDIKNIYEEVIKYEEIKLELLSQLQWNRDREEIIDQITVDIKKTCEEMVRDKELKGNLFLLDEFSRDKEELYSKLIDQEIVNLKESYDKSNKDVEIRLEVFSKLQSNRDSEYKKYTQLHEQILSEPIDVLNGGFPCQAFSIAGEQKGFEDERGNLFFYIVDLIEKLGEKFYKPRVLFLENVKNLQSHDEERTYKVIKKKLEDCGYTIFEKVLNTMDYTDLPQNRERIYIIGFLNAEDAKRFKLFNPENLGRLLKVKTSADRVEDVKKVIDYSFTSDKGEKYYYTRKKYPNYFVTQEEFEKSDKRKEIRINLEEQIDEMYQFYQCRRGMYVRKNKSDVCPTLTANMGTGGHNVPLIKVADGIRKLTPAETFKLQGFPIGKGYELPVKHKGKAYSDAQLYKQAGNAVSVPVITMLVTEILRTIE